jgi:hypothetical protein
MRLRSSVESHYQFCDEHQTNIRFALLIAFVNPRQCFCLVPTRVTITFGDG